MVLGEGLIDRDGKAHEMLGFLGLETSFEKRKLHLGYRKLKAKSEFFAGTQVYAHEFHYTSVIKQPVTRCLKRKMRWVYSWKIKGCAMEILWVHICI